MRGLLVQDRRAGSCHHYGPTGYAQGTLCLLSSPIRLLDTRAAATDGVTLPGTPLSGGVDVQSAGHGGGPASDLGADRGRGGDRQGGGSRRCGPRLPHLLPDGVTKPTTSSVNCPLATAVADGVTVALSTLGTMDSFASQTTDIIFDATGFAASVGMFRCPAGGCRRRALDSTMPTG